QARLSDRRLLGHVLAHRWLREGAESPGAEALRAWLQRYGDQPDAPAIHAPLAQSAGPDEPLPDTPVARMLSPNAGAAPAAHAPPERPPALDAGLRARAAAGEAAAAAARIDSRRGLSPDRAMALKTEVATIAFRAGRD